MVDKLEHAGSKQGQCSTVDGLSVRVVSHTEYLRMLRIIDIQREVVTSQHPVKTRRDELIQRYLSTCDLSLQLILGATLQRIGERLDFRLKFRIS